MRVNLTRAGFEKLSEELKRLKTVKRREIATALELARAKGDLSENAEYDAAKDEQAHLERRIAELEGSLVNVRIIDGQDIDPNKAFIGAHITLIDQDSHASITYMLVSKEEASLKEKKISVESPIGSAIVGKAVGDEVEVTIPAGKKRYKLTKIER
jgi:transcription elongation factor GreA